MDEQNGSAVVVGDGRRERQVRLLAWIRLARIYQRVDRATAELMQLFYSNVLQHGMKTSEALRAAQNSIRQRPEWRSPHYWAAFTLQGESQIIKPKTETRVLSYSKIYVPAVGLLLVALIWWVVRVRKFRRVT